MFSAKQKRNETLKCQSKVQMLKRKFVDVTICFLTFIETRVSDQGATSYRKIISKSVTLTFRQIQQQDRISSSISL